MKKVFLIILIFTFNQSYSQQKDTLKYQFKVNIYSLVNKGYGSSFNLGFETRQKRINYGVDFFTY